VGIEPTHQPWEGRRLPLHHTRASGDLRFEPFHTLPYNPRFGGGVRPKRKQAPLPFQPIALIERATTRTIVISEITASKVISAFAHRLSGIVSVGLKAVELVNERYM
jgi:hypothetical protein